MRNVQCGSLGTLYADAVPPGASLYRSRHRVGYEASAPSARRTADAREHQRRVWASAVVSHALFPRRPCLPQSLATRYLLARAGCSTELRIGVRRQGAGLAAHAWLEKDGVPVIDAEGTASFAPLQAPLAPHKPSA